MELTGTNRSRAYPLRSGNMYKRRWKDEIMCGFEGTGKEQESGDWCLFFFVLYRKQEKR